MELKEKLIKKGYKVDWDFSPCCINCKFSEYEPKRETGYACYLDKENPVEVDEDHHCDNYKYFEEK
jgi:hypothetical protein